MRYNSKLETLSIRDVAAIALAVADRVVRIPLYPPTLIPFLSYAPFMVVNALKPLGSIAIEDSTHWCGIGTVVLAVVLPVF